MSYSNILKSTVSLNTISIFEKNAPVYSRVPEYKSN